MATREEGVSTFVQNENISPLVLRRVTKEIAKLTKTPPEGIKVHINEADITDIQATIVGPESTPYEGGVFRVRLSLSPDFPNSPPKGYFLTKIFHPNVADSGEICVNTLKKDWKAENSLEHVFTVIKCLLIHPNPASALNEEAGKLLLEDFDGFAKHAQMMTRIYARPTTTTAETEDSASENSVVEKKPAKKKDDKKKKALKRL
eukprot:m.37809 g.37809  ORF g.37809 m.37809 type:complete len:204 (+) comp11432_c1_seq1:349-960(+)